MTLEPSGLWHDAADCQIRRDVSATRSANFMTVEERRLTKKDEKRWLGYEI